MAPIYKRFNKVINQQKLKNEKLSIELHEERMERNFEDYFPPLKPDTSISNGGDLKHRRFNSFLRDINGWQQK